MKTSPKNSLFSLLVNTPILGLTYTLLLGAIIFVNLVYLRQRMIKAAGAFCHRLSRHYPPTHSPEK